MRGWGFGHGLVLAVAVGFAAFCSPASSQERDAWKKLKFLMGSWSGEGAGSPGQVSKATASFTLDLNRKILVRKNRAEFAPKPGAAGPDVHEDLMIIYPQQDIDSFRAVYFDSEGHVVRYRVSFPTQANSAQFNTEDGEKGPRFRLTYRMEGDGRILTDFQMAPPGGELKSYLKGAMTRRR